MRDHIAPLISAGEQDSGAVGPRLDRAAPGGTLGEVGDLDVSPYLDFGVFSRLRAPGAFQAVRVAFNTVEWECGVDLDPEFVYEKCRMLAE